MITCCKQHHLTNKSVTRTILADQSGGKCPEKSPLGGHRVVSTVDEWGNSVFVVFCDHLLVFTADVGESLTFWWPRSVWTSKV